MGIFALIAEHHAAASLLSFSAVLATIIYVAFLVIYRLYLSPLAKFPGPKLAAATGWVEFYYDFFKVGHYMYEIEKMHEKYGPIVRVNPDELSIRDGAYFDELYVTGNKRRTNGYDGFGHGVGFDGSHFLTTDHDMHRRRRKPLEPFFSHTGVQRLEPMLAGLARKLDRRFRALEGTQTVLRLDHVLTAFAGDVVTKLCCEQNEDFLDDPDFAPHWFELFHAITRSTTVFTGFPTLVNCIKLIPPFILSRIDKRNQHFNDFKLLAEGHIMEAMDAKRQGKNARQKNDVDSRNSLFRHIMDSDMPESEISLDRLSNEAQVLLGAGTVTSARTLDTIVYYLLANPEMKARLTEELKESMKDFLETFPSWAHLEKLSYLQACIKEGLRISYGTMHRLPRVSPDVALQYKEWTIPKGVPVGMSAYFMHTDVDIFPRPFEFLPERWLGDFNPLMTRNLVPYCRGSRVCLGMNVANAEMNYVLATLFRPGAPEFKLFRTDESDVKQKHVFLLPLPKLESKGIRVMIS